MDKLITNILLPGWLTLGVLLFLGSIFCAYTAPNSLVPIGTTKLDQAMLYNKNHNSIIIMMDRSGTTVEVKLKESISVETYKELTNHG